MRPGITIFLVLYTLALWVTSVQGHGNRVMDDETYDVKRKKHLFGLTEDGKALMFDGKLVAKKTKLKGIVKMGLEETKGSGARKLNVYLKDQYSGISTRNVQKVLDKSKRYHLQKASFGNVPIPKPIRAKTVQERHQMDLLDMGKWAVKHGTGGYRYILTVIDIFSQYIWLRPLKSKQSQEIAKHLAEIYTEHGPPKIMQHDQGKEFKGSVQKLMEKYQIKVIQSSPYHPQSQGKVERTHRVLRRKIMYDFVNFKRGGVNWAAHMPKYAKVMNLDKKEVLNWMSPYEVYYGRKNNFRTSGPLSGHTGAAGLDSIHHEEEQSMDPLPSRRDRALFEKNRQKIRKRALKATERCMNRMVKSRKIPPPSIYNLHDKVLVRLRKGLRFSKRYAVVPGIVMNRNEDLSKYKVKH